MGGVVHHGVGDRGDDGRAAPRVEGDPRPGAVSDGMVDLPSGGEPVRDAPRRPDLPLRILQRFLLLGHAGGLARGSGTGRARRP